MKCSSDRQSIMPATWKSGEMFCLLRSVLLQCHGVSIKVSRGIGRSEIVVVMWFVFWLDSLKLFLLVCFSRDPCTVNLQTTSQGQTLLKPLSLLRKDYIQKIRTAQNNVHQGDFEHCYIYFYFFCLVLQFCSHFLIRCCHVFKETYCYIYKVT